MTAACCLRLLAVPGHQTSSWTRLPVQIVMVCSEFLHEVNNPGGLSRRGISLLSQLMNAQQLLKLTASGDNAAAELHGMAPVRL